MSELGHDLHTLFPADRTILHTLKIENDHFRKLAHDYHSLTQGISRIETGIEPTTDEHLEKLKKERLHILDEVAAMIAAAKVA
jgi:uncharacterized protein YdcH (DUF465 family)